MYQDPNQNPYGTPPPQDQYGVPQNPYGPQSGQYGTPPPQNPYGVPPGYGYGGPPPSAPLPLGEALRQLPNQYMRVITKPSAATFAQEIGKASWDIVWVQLLIYAVISALLSYISILFMPNRFNFTGAAATPMPAGTLQAITLGSSFGLVILVPLFFFIGIGITYLIAKAFKGTGTFVAQSYAVLLYSVPLGIISSLLGLIPILGTVVSLAVGIYDIVLAIFAVMAVHRLSGGKATAVILIPAGVAVLLAICAFVVLIGIIAASLPR